MGRVEVATDESAGAPDDVSDLVSDEELRALLVALAERPSTEQRYALRAKIVLLTVLGGESTGAVAAQLGGDGTYGPEVEQPLRMRAVSRGAQG